MAKQTVKITGWEKFKATLLGTVKTGDSADLEKALDAAEEEAEEGGDTHVHIHPSATADAEAEAEAKKVADAANEVRWTALDERISALELAGKKTADAEETDEEKAAAKKKADEEAEAVADALEEEAPEAVGDEARTVADSRWLEDAFQSTISAGEILAPGITFPVFDISAAPAITLDSLTAFRRKVLSIAASTPAGATSLAELRGGKAITHDSIEASPHAEIRTLFHGAAVAAKRRNSITVAAAVFESGVYRTGDSGKRRDVNALNAEFWKTQGIGK